MTEQGWVEIVVPASAEDVDELAALLAEELPAAAAGTELRGDEIVFWAALDTAEAVLAQTRAAVGVLAERGAALDPGAVRAQSALPEHEWRDAWKRYFHVTRIGPRVVIVPSWERHDAAPGEAIIHLDPGMAFGTGTHASTRLVLEELQRLAEGGDPPERVLDVGAGSGILAIAACRLWPSTRAVAIDNDPIAVAACAENCRRNEVDDRVVSSLDPLEALEHSFPLVLANIQAHVLRALADALRARLAPGGTLVMSGLLTTQVEGVAEEFAAAGLELVAIRPCVEDPAWSSAVLRAPARG
jgi:ribosomal protein L11 methyltransferase